MINLICNRIEQCINYACLAIAEIRLAYVRVRIDFYLWREC